MNPAGQAGHVVDTNVVYRRPDGTLITDGDIVLKNAVLQIKSGGGIGLPKQLVATTEATDLPVIAHGPTLGRHVIRQIQREGNLVTRDLDLLIDVVAPDPIKPP